MPRTGSSISSSLLRICRTSTSGLLFVCFVWAIPNGAKACSASSRRSLGRWLLTNAYVWSWCILLYLFFRDLLYSSLLGALNLLRTSPHQLSYHALRIFLGSPHRNCSWPLSQSYIILQHLSCHVCANRKSGCERALMDHYVGVPKSLACMASTIFVVCWRPVSLFYLQGTLWSPGLV